ncbi:MAG: hypothetical protein ACOCVF_00145 [bacterium]
MIQFNRLFQPITLYDGLYTKVMYNLKYKTLNDVKNHDNVLYDIWCNKYPDKPDEKYLTHAHYHFDFIELNGVYTCTLSHENDKLNRFFKKFIGTPQNIIEQFLEYFNQNFKKTSFFVGYDLQYELSILIKYMIKFNIKIPDSLKTYLDMKPWDDSFFLDVKYVWKFGDTYGITSEISQMASFLNLKSTMDIVPMHKLVQMDQIQDKEIIMKNGMNYCNIYAQILYKLRTQGI